MHTKYLLAIEWIRKQNPIQKSNIFRPFARSFVNDSDVCLCTQLQSSTSLKRLPSISVHSGESQFLLSCQIEHTTKPQMYPSNLPPSSALGRNRILTMQSKNPNPTSQNNIKGIRSTSHALTIWPGKSLLHISTSKPQPVCKSSVGQGVSQLENFSRN